MWCTCFNMEKKGLVEMIILGILGFLLIVVIGAGIYFYNYHVFKEIRVCVGEWQDTQFPCETRKNCLDAMNFSNKAVEGAPDFVVKNFEDILDAVVYCDGNCFAGVVRGIDYASGELENLEGCESEEDEFIMEIDGRNGLEILKWMKSRSELE